MRASSIFGLLLVTNINALAKVDSDSLNFKEPQQVSVADVISETAWADPHPHNIQVRTGIYKSENTISLVGIEGDEFITLKPARSDRPFLSIMSNSLGLSYSFSPQGDYKKNIHSNLETYHLSYLWKNLLFEGVYQRTSGFYYYKVDKEDKPLGFNSDIRATNIKLSLNYYLNPDRFSPNVAFNQLGQQWKSGGSHLLYLTASKNEFSSSQNWLPFQYFSQLSINTLINRVTTQSVSGGYGYQWMTPKTFSVKNFYSVLGIMFGLGTAETVTSYLDTPFKKTGLIVNSNTRLGAGYYDGVWSAGVDFNITSETMQSMGASMRRLYHMQFHVARNFF